MSGNAGTPLGAWTFADRANLPFVDDAALLGHEEPWLPGQTIAAQAFRDRGWGASFYAWAVLVEVAPRLELSVLAATGGSPRGRVAWRPPGQPPVQREFDGPRPVDAAMIAELIDLARSERADALPAILEQRDEFASHFMALLGMAPATNPATERLVRAAAMIGGWCAMFFKAEWNLARPSEFYPGLSPPIEVPAHPSFPSGHATQAWLMAQCLRQAVAPPDGRAEDARTRALDALAGRIARNREIAGVHTAQDSAAGRDLAAGIAEIMAAMAAHPDGFPRLRALYAAARAEWAGRTPAPGAARR